MNTASRLAQSDNIKIEEIIDSLYRFAFRDIKVNIDNPIAAFILISCFIDQMGAYAYNTQKGQTSEHYKKFITQYLNPLDPFQLWTTLRNALVHNYTLSPNISLTDRIDVRHHSQVNINANEFTVENFINALEIAFVKFSKDLRNHDSEEREKALLKYNESPIIIGVNKSVWQYEKTEADFLVSYYSDKIIGKYLNGHSELPITSLIAEKIDNVYIVKCLANKGNINYEAKLDIITQQLDLKYPVEALKEAGLYVESTPL